MADQMTPDEMRETAKRLRGQGLFATDERAGADALDRLSDVIEYAERAASRLGSPTGTVAHQVLRLARGDTINRENRSE